MTPWHRLMVVMFTAGVLVAAVTPFLRRLAERTRMVAYPKADRWHSRSVPMLGGVAIFAGTVGAVALNGWVGPAGFAVVFAAAGMFVLGLLDDFLKLKPNSKLTAQIAVACGVVMLQPPPDFTGWAAFNLLLAIVWIVAITNAFNLLDNMDGLSAGIAAIAGIACAADLLGGGSPLAAVAAALAGASAGFLVFNFKPASIFMGDAGSLFLGGTLAVLSLAGGTGVGAGVVSTLAVPVFILLIPIFDTAFVTMSRLLSTRSASQGGRDHTSHRLVALGFSESQAVLILYALAAAGGAAGLIARYSSTFDALTVAPLLLIALALLGVHLSRVGVYGGEDFSLLLGKPYTPLLADVTYKRRIFEVLLDVVLVTFSYYAAYIIRFDRDVAVYYHLFVQSLPVVLACQLLSLFVVGVYRGSWRYIGLADLTTYGKAIALGVLSTVMVLVYLYRFEGYSRGVFIIDAMLLALLLVGSRLSFRLIGDAAGRRRSGTPVLIYGAGDGGALLLRELRNNPAYQYQPVAFLDDDPGKQQKTVQRLRIVGGIDALERTIGEHAPKAVIVSTSRLEPTRFAELARVCGKTGTALLQLRFSLDEIGVAPSAGRQE